MIINRKCLFCFVSILFIITGCKGLADKKCSENRFGTTNAAFIDYSSTDKRNSENQSSSGDSSQIFEVTELIWAVAENENQKLNGENEAWVDEYVDKDFLLGKVTRSDNPLFVRVEKEHTERNIYLIHAVYEAYKKMHEAALADSVPLIITSGHRTFLEQVCEWELRWNNPRTDSIFENEVDKARYLLQYRAIPGTTRHHWGTDIDLNSFELAYYQSEEGIKVYNWLKEHAATYGFFQPYTPLNEKRPKGYNEEKWHWSYRPLSKLMLTKYLALVSINEITGFKGEAAAKKLPIIAEWVNGINTQLKEKQE